MQTNFMDLDVLEELKVQEETKNNKKLRIAQMVIILDIIVFVVFIVPRLLGIIPLSQSWVLFFNYCCDWCDSCRLCG